MLPQPCGDRLEPDRAVPALRQGPATWSSTTRAGSSTSRTRTRPATGSRTPSRSRPALVRRHRARGRPVQLHPQQREDRHGRLRRHDDVLRGRPERPDPARLHGHLPGPVPAALRGARRAASAPARARGAVQRPDARVRVVPRHASRETFYQRTDLWTVPDGRGQRAVAADRGVLRRDADARRARDRVPAAPADGPATAAEHDRLGRGPQRRRRTTARSASTSSRSDTSVLGPDQIEAQISADPADQLPDHAVEPVRQQGRSAATCSSSRSRTRSSTCSRSTSSRRRARSRSSSGSSSRLDERIVWANTLSEALRLAPRGRPEPDADALAGPTLAGRLARTDRLAGRVARPPDRRRRRSRPTSRRHPPATSTRWSPTRTSTSSWRRPPCATVTSGATAGDRGRRRRRCG